MTDDLERLYRSRLDAFVRAAAAIAGGCEEGRDAVQDAFAKAVRTQRRYRGEGTLEAWVWQIVVNAARATYGVAGVPLPSSTHRPAPRKLVCDCHWSC